MKKSAEINFDLINEKKLNEDWMELLTVCSEVNIKYRVSCAIILP